MIIYAKNTLFYRISGGSRPSAKERARLTMNVIIIIIIKTYLCRMTISVIKTAINMGPAIKKKKKTRPKKSYIRNREIILKLEFIYNY